MTDFDLPDEEWEDIWNEYDSIPTMTEQERFDFQRGEDFYKSGMAYRQSWSKQMKDGFLAAREIATLERLEYLEGFYAFFNNEKTEPNWSTLMIRGYADALTMFDNKRNYGDFNPNREDEND